MVLEDKNTEKNEKGVDNFEKESDDPWDLPQLKVNSTPWSELSLKGKVWRVTWGFLRLVLLLGFLYMFICSLDFLGTAFKLLGGKTAGKAFRETELLSNPVAGLMIGVLVTVLVQSSSTSTSIIITMVGGNLLKVNQAIYIVMGANIGTTVTNTIVSLAQAPQKDEFRRAFGAATVHDMFNWLTVMILLPLEAASGLLYRLTNKIIMSMHLETKDGTKQDILKVITKPFTKLIIKIDKKVIENIAKTSTSEALEKELAKDILITWCPKDGDAYNVTSLQNVTVPCIAPEAGDMAATVGSSITSTMSSLNATINATINGTLNAMLDSDDTTASNETWCTTLANVTETRYEKIKLRCHNLFAQGKGDFKLSDSAAGAILLIVAIVILCICLACIVKLLQSIFKGAIAKVIRKVLNNDFPGIFGFLTGYVAILVGAALTIVVQSSSIFTSTLTPLVGVGVIKLDRMYPLTLGANIGTTTTGILAALASDYKKLADTLQLAFCHLFFNIIGIVIWYPIPLMRKVPLHLAKALGDTTAEYKWFALVYLFFIFFIFPAVIFGLSLAGWYVLLAVGGPILILLVFVVVINVMQAKCKSKIYPAKLRSWNWLPLPLRSLQPYDNALRFLCKPKCCRALCAEKSSEEEFTSVAVESSGFEKGKDNMAYQPFGKEDNVMTQKF